jgi:hypothetical protein
MADNTTTDDATIDETAAEVIVDRVAEAVATDLPSDEAAWARDAIRVLVSLSLPVEDGEDSELADELIGLLGASSRDERYELLIGTYYEAVIRDLSDRAFVLALDGRARHDPARTEAAQVVADALGVLVDELEQSAPEVGEYLGLEIAEALTDCACVLGDDDLPSLRLANAWADDAAREEYFARVGPADPEIDALAEQAWEDLTMSRVAAEFAVESGVTDTREVVPIRVRYDRAIGALDELSQRFGPEALRRVGDDVVRTDLLIADDDRIDPIEWTAADDADAMLGVRLARAV